MTHQKPPTDRPLFRILLGSLALCGATGSVHAASVSQGSVSPHLVVGSIDDGTEGYWLCDVTTTDRTIADHIVKLRPDGTGISGAELLHWHETDDHAIVFDLEEGAVRLYDFSFSTSDAPETRFSASSDAGESLDCRYDGPASAAPGASFDQPTPGQIFHTAANDPADVWSCQFDQERSAAPPVSYAFYSSGMGGRNGEPFEWHVEKETGDLIIAGLDAIDELRDIVFVTGTDGRQFVAHDQEYAVLCDRQSF